MKKFWQEHGRKVMGTALIIALALAIGFSAAFAGGNAPTAQEFMEARMYPQAIALLNQQINKSPKNAMAHYNLAICYLRTGRLNDADASFERAVLLARKLGLQVGKEYVLAGAIELDRNKSYAAHELMGNALRYDPGLQEIVGAAYRQSGENALLRNDLATAKDSFSRAIGYNEAHRAPALAAFLGRGKRLLAAGDDSKAENFFAAAQRMSADEANRQLCDIYFEIGKERAAAGKTELIEKAGRYCGNRYHEEILQAILDSPPGKGYKIELGPKETKNVAVVDSGAKLRYYAASGVFFDRVDDGTGRMKFGPSSAGPSYTAHVKGTLQVRAGDSPVVLLLKITE